MPVTFSITPRAGPTLLIAFTTGANVVATLPWRSVRARSLALAGTLPAFSWIASDRSMRRGKSITQLLLALGHVRAHDVAELALVALVDHALVLGVGEHLHVVGAVVVASSTISNSERKLGHKPHADPAVAAGLERAVALGSRAASGSR